MAERYVLIVLALTSSVIVARLLTPEEIGIYAIVSALIGVAQVVRDFGIGSYLVQEQVLTRRHLESAFGVSLAIGVLLFLVFIAAASLAGAFYGDPRIAQIVRIVAFNFLLLPFCSISLSLLRRDMRFGRIMAANMAGTIAGVVVLLCLAWIGKGPMSLAWGSLVTNATTGFVAWLLNHDHLIVRPGISHWREIFRFGGQSTVAAVVASLAIDINDLVVGKLLGFSSVAMLSRAQGLMNLFHRDIMNAVRGVAFPAFAKSYREGEAMERKYVVAVANVTVFAWPFYGLTALFPLEIMRLLYGPQWDEASLLVPWFCLAGATAATFSLINAWMIAIGRNDLVTRAELIVQTLRVVLVSAAALLFKSLIACALAFVMAFVVATPIFYRFKSIARPAEVGNLFRGFRASASVALLSLLIPGIISLCLNLGRNEPISLTVFALALLAAAVSWLGAVIVLKHPITTDLLFQRVTTILWFKR